MGKRGNRSVLQPHRLILPFAPRTLAGFAEGLSADSSSFAMLAGSVPHFDFPSEKSEVLVPTPLPCLTDSRTHSPPSIRAYSWLLSSLFFFVMTMPSFAFRVMVRSNLDASSSGFGRRVLGISLK